MRYLVVLAACAIGCSGTTGSALVTFAARAGGPADANGTLEFDSTTRCSAEGKCTGYHIALTSAKLHLGALYLDMANLSSGGAEEPCVLKGYVGEAVGSCGAGGCGVDLDLLSPALVPFATPGQGTANRARWGQVWLTSGDVNAPEDPVPVLQIAGTASTAAQKWPFTATMTIGSNRARTSPTPATPGINPICVQRIVTPIPLGTWPPPSAAGGGLTLSDGGTLDLRIDPREMFNGVEFSSLTASPDGSYVIPDEEAGVGAALFHGVTAASAKAYQFSFTAKR
jgi:hypothetical protein